MDRRGFFGFAKGIAAILGAGIVTRSYEAWAISSGTWGVPFCYPYPNEDELFKGTSRFDPIEFVFEQGLEAFGSSGAIGPLVVAETRVEDLARLALDAERFVHLPYACHPGPGNNAILVAPARLSDLWVFAYLTFGQAEGGYLPTRREYALDDVLLAVDLVLGPEASLAPKMHPKSLELLGQRPFDGALLYESKDHPGVVVTQLSGPVAIEDVPDLVKATVADPAGMAIERVSLSALGDGDREWFTAGIGLGAGFGGATIDPGEVGNWDCVLDCRWCDLCTVCLACTVCMEPDKEPGCETCLNKHPVADHLDGCSVMYTADILGGVPASIPITQPVRVENSFKSLNRAEERIRNMYLKMVEALK